MAKRLGIWDEIATILLSLVLLAFPVYWLLDYEKPFEFTRLVQSGEALPGGQLQVLTEGTRVRDCPVNVQIILHDGGNRRYLARSVTYESPGDLGKTSYMVAIDIPQWFKPGMGLYTVVLAYRCNPWQILIDPKVIQKTIPVVFDDK